MPVEHSQELIEEIRTHVQTYMAELREMEREAINARYQEILGVEPHPRMHLDMMVKMIARFYQGQLWYERTGDIPPEVRSKDLNFWLEMEAYFVPKEVVKQERAKPVTLRSKSVSNTKALPGSNGTGLQNKTKNIEDAVLHLIKEVEGNSEVAKGAAIITKYGEEGNIDFSAFAKRYKKEGTFPPNMVALLMKREGVIELQYPEDEVEEQPEQKEDADVNMTFEEVLEHIQPNEEELCVESESVDFGIGERVSDY